MNLEEPNERVRNNTSSTNNQSVDEKTLAHIQQVRSSGDINRQLEALDKEWDIEKTLEVNASSLAFLGLVLGYFVNELWLLLPAVVLLFLFQHGIQGWCPPLPIFRKMGIRTAREINEERTALKVLRGDFNTVTTNPEGLLELIRRN